MSHRKKTTLMAQTEQPIHWSRAFWSGVFGVSMMMGFFDVFYVLGATPFTFEQYLGSLLRGTTVGHQNWVVGMFANWIFGGLCGFVYAWAFEFVFKRAGGRVGTYLGLIHAVIAAVAVFPFFGILHAQMGTGLFPEFGFFGTGLGAQTPILLLMGHWLFGATVGIFYGPVRAARARARVSEPDAHDDELRHVLATDDWHDSRLVYRQGG